jgi:excisionase family DNA binding protein
MNADGELLKIEDVCRQLQISRSGVYRLIWSGKLPAVKLGQRTLRFKPEDVRALLETSTATSEPNQ